MVALMTAAQPDMKLYWFLLAQTRARWDHVVDSLAVGFPSLATSAHKMDLRVHLPPQALMERATTGRWMAAIVDGQGRSEACLQGAFPSGVAWEPVDRHLWHVWAIAAWLLQ